MSYSNKTSNYELPLYVGTDKPTYLGDWNETMQKIDTNMKSIDTKGTNAENIANNANTVAQNALEKANEAETSVNDKVDEVRTIAQSAQATANKASIDAQTATTNALNAQAVAEAAKQSADESSKVLSVANEAKTIAQTADANANLAKSSVNNLETSVDDWVSGTLTQLSNATFYYNFNTKLKLLNFYGSATLNPAIDPDTDITIGKLPDSFPKPSQRRTIARCITFYNSAFSKEGTGTLIIETDNTVKFHTPIASMIEKNSGVGLQVMLCTNGWTD